MHLYVVSQLLCPCLTDPLYENLVCAILLAFFGCKHLYKAFALPQVDEDQLKSFREGNAEAKEKYGPKL